MSFSVHRHDAPRNTPGIVYKLETQKQADAWIAAQENPADYYTCYTPDWEPCAEYREDMGR